MAREKQFPPLRISIILAIAVVLLTFFGFVEVLAVKTVSPIKAACWFPFGMLVKVLTENEVAMVAAALLQFPVFGFALFTLSRRWGLPISLVIVGGMYLALVILAWQLLH
jgi:hypothetical protein